MERSESNMVYGPAREQHDIWTGAIATLFLGEILKDLDFSFAHGKHPFLQSFPQEHIQQLCIPLPNSKPIAPSWTHPIVLYVSLKYPSWDIRPHPKVPGSPITHRYSCQHPKVSHYSHSLWRLPPSKYPLPPHSYWPCWPSTILSRILILSHSTTDPQFIWCLLNGKVSSSGHSYTNNYCPSTFSISKKHENLQRIEPVTGRSQIRNPIFYWVFNYSLIVF